MKTSIIASIVISGILVAGNSVYAASPAEDLYAKAKRAMQEKNYAVACPMFAESYIIASKEFGPRALFALATCEYESNKLRESRKHYQEFLEVHKTLSVSLKLKYKDFVESALVQLELIRKEMPTRTLIPPKEPPPKGTRILVDGKEIEISSLGQPMEMDVGDHSIRTEAPGHTAWEHPIAVAKGDAFDVPLEWPKEIIEVKIEKPKMNTRQKAAIAVGGVGVAGLVVGGVTGGLAMSNKKIADANCVVQNCTAVGADAGTTGRLQANVATVAFSVGLAGLATGAVLWLTAPKPKDAATPTGAIQFDVFGVGLNGMMVGFRGTF